MKAIAAAKLAEAQAADNEARNIMTKLNYEMDVRKQDFYEEMTQKQFDRAGQKTGYTPYEPQADITSGNMPNFTPASGYGTKSDDGQWVYTGEGEFGWEPTYEASTQSMINQLSNPNLSKEDYNRLVDRIQLQMDVEEQKRKAEEDKADEDPFEAYRNKIK